jgi:hypothetical protein
VDLAEAQEVGKPCQVPKLSDSLAAVAAVVPFYVAFPVVMPFVGKAVARLFPTSRAIVFTGATHNSLVLLLALLDNLAFAAVLVVTPIRATSGRLEVLICHAIGLCAEVVPEPVLT